MSGTGKINPPLAPGGGKPGEEPSVPSPPTSQKPAASGPQTPALPEPIARAAEGAAQPSPSSPSSGQVAVAPPEGADAIPAAAGPGADELPLPQDGEPERRGDAGDESGTLSSEPLPLTDQPASSLKEEQFGPGVVSRNGRRRLAHVLLIGSAVSLLLLALAMPPVYLLRQPLIDVEQLHQGQYRTATVGPSSKQWVSLKTMNKFFTYAIITAEDGRFYDHVGLDPVEIINSVKANMKAGSYKRGASTITQQVVRICFLRRDKTLWRKMRETVGALVLELILDKDEILEWYVNLVEFGPGVYGIKAASYNYFGTHPTYLTLTEGIQLAMVLPSPSIWSRSLRQKRLTSFGRSRYLQILRGMRGAGYVSEGQFSQALRTGDFGRPLGSGGRP